MPDDSKEPVHIVSDTSLFNYKTGVNTYEGHVKVDQGSTHITSDRLITRNNTQHKIKEAIAYGVKQPAHYWTLPKSNDKEVHAHAMIIKFYPIAKNVALEQQVTISQGDNNFEGQLIFYNMQNQTITVPASQTGRAVLVYNPDN